MPAKKFLVEKEVEKRIKKLPAQIKKRIPEVLLSIKDNPVLGIRLHGELYGLYKFRIGDYRIIYRFDSKQSVVTVVKIEHRQGVYK